MKKLILTIALVLLAGVAVANVVLTTPEQVRSELGGIATVQYDEIRTLTIAVSPDDDTVDHSFELFASSDAALPIYRGRYSIDAVAGTAQLRVEQLGFETGVTLTTGQKAAVRNFIDGHVAQVEDSLVTFGLIDGVQQ